MANLYESLPAGLNHAQPPPPPPPATPPPPAQAPNPAPPPSPQPSNNQQQQKGGKGRGGKRYTPALHRGGGVRPLPPPLPNEPRKAVAVGGAVEAAPGGIKNAAGGNNEEKIGKFEMLKSGPHQPPSSMNQRSDVSFHFAGMDKEYHEEQTGDPGFDLVNDMETNDIFAIRIARERNKRKQKEKYACLAIIIMISLGAVLTFATLFLIALDFS